MSASPRQYTFTRDELTEALTRIKIRPLGGKVVAEWMADAILETLDDLAAEADSARQGPVRETEEG